MLGGAAVAATTFCGVTAAVGYWPAVLATLGAALGSRAPDAMELPIGEHFRAIPHRTITHWLLLWVAVAVGCGYQLIATEMAVWAAPLGFAIGCIGHITGDWLTPMGIPVLHPVRRHSLRLGASGGLIELIWLGFWGGIAALSFSLLLN